jgi:hypothetical protein
MGGVGGGRNGSMAAAVVAAMGRRARFA